MKKAYLIYLLPFLSAVNEENNVFNMNLITFYFHNSYTPTVPHISEIIVKLNYRTRKKKANWYYISNYNRHTVATNISLFTGYFCIQCILNQREANYLSFGYFPIQESDKVHLKANN